MIRDHANSTNTTASFLAIDKKNNLYFAGHHQVTYPNGKKIWHGYIQKMDVNGNLGWYVTTSTSVNQPEPGSYYNFSITSMSVDDNGDIYIACQHAGKIGLGPGLEFPPAEDYAIIKLSQPGY